MTQTGIPVVDWFLAVLDTWGYVIVFGFTVFENLFVVGSFTPGETVVIAAAFVASRGDLIIWLVWIASVVGTVIGSNISYWLGRRAGLETVHDFTQRAFGDPGGQAASHRCLGCPGGARALPHPRRQDGAAVAVRHRRQELRARRGGRDADAGVLVRALHLLRRRALHDADVSCSAGSSARTSTWRFEWPRESDGSGCSSSACSWPA